MSDAIIPPEVRAFVMEQVDSVVEMEAMLLLRKHGDRLWSARELAPLLYISQAQAQQLLESLASKGVVTDNFRYQPATPQQGGLIDALAQAYKTSLLTLTELIHRKKP